MTKRLLTCLIIISLIVTIALNLKNDKETNFQASLPPKTVSLPKKMRTRVTPEPLPKAPLVPTNSQTPKNYIPATNASQELIDEQTKIVAEGYGSFPAVDLKNMTPHKQHVLDALKAPHKNSGVVSIVGKREKFDLSRYQQAPSYYLDTVEAGRAFDSIQAGDGVTPITRIGSGFQETEQNKPITLTAKGSPEMPVSFTVFDGGQFQNGLSFITVQADSSGYASVEFTATAGVINQTRIKAASPVNSQTVNWKVLVHLPKEISKNNN